MWQVGETKEQKSLNSNYISQVWPTYGVQCNLYAWYADWFLYIWLDL